MPSASNSDMIQVPTRALLEYYQQFIYSSTRSKEGVLIGYLLTWLLSPRGCNSCKQTCRKPVSVAELYTLVYSIRIPTECTLPPFPTGWSTVRYVQRTDVPKVVRNRMGYPWGRASTGLLAWPDKLEPGSSAAVIACMNVRNNAVSAAHTACDLPNLQSEQQTSSQGPSPSGFEVRECPIIDDTMDGSPVLAVMWISLTYSRKPIFFFAALGTLFISPPSPW